MKRILPRLAAGLTVLALPMSAGALSQVGFSLQTSSTTELVDVVVNVINYVLGLLGLVAVIMVLWGGYTWLTAGGNEDKVKKAKDVISAAVIGIVVVLIAWAIVNFVINTGTNVTNGA